MNHFDVSSVVLASISHFSCHSVGDTIKVHSHSTVTLFTFALWWIQSIDSISIASRCWNDSLGLSKTQFYQKERLQVRHWFEDTNRGMIENAVSWIWLIWSTEVSNCEFFNLWHCSWITMDRSACLLLLCHYGLRSLFHDCKQWMHLIYFYKPAFIWTSDNRINKTTWESNSQLLSTLSFFTRGLVCIQPFQHLKIVHVMSPKQHIAVGF